MKLRGTKKLLAIFWVALFLAAANQFSNAQTGGSISGRVEDTSGAAIPGAAVTITNLETGAARSVVTDEVGNYRVLSLPVGQYQIKSEKTGFQEQVQTGINLVVGQQAVINLRLAVGDVQQQVTVVGEAPLVNTTTASVSGLVGERQVKDLPLNGRSFDQLLTLNTSAINFSSHGVMNSSGGGQGNTFSVAGRRPADNIYLMNGVEYTGAGIISRTPGGASAQLLGIDAIREFNVLSGTYSSEYGKYPGAQLTVVTQSGTNAVHGSAFEFLRNNKLDARNFFDKAGVPPFKRNQFGGSLGGPIQKDKTFLFGSYEGFRQRLGLSIVTFVPDLNARQGLLPNAQGVPTPVPGLDRRMLPFMDAYWPQPNGPSLGGGVALAFSNPAQSIRDDFGTTRFDHNFSDRDFFSAVYTIDDGFNLSPLSDPLFGLMQLIRNQVLSASETHVFSPQLINTFTAGLSRAGWTFDSPSLGNFPANLSFFAGREPGTINIGAGSTTASSLTQAGPNLTPFARMARNLFTYQDGLQIIKGKHQISVGAWFLRTRENEIIPVFGRGRAVFANLQSFLQGNLVQFAGIANPSPLGWRSLMGAWYFQDNIQVRSNLSLQLGLRHEFTNGWNEVAGRASTWHFDQNGDFLTNPTVGSSPLTENNAKRLFGPRIGLAWDPFGKGKTSIRAGFGIHYALVDQIGFPLDVDPPVNGQVSFTNVSLFSFAPLSPGAALPPDAKTSLWGVESNMKTPTVIAWNFSVEQQLSQNMALRLAYVGSSGYHDWINTVPNTIHPQICSSPAGCISGGVGAARGNVPQGAEYIPVTTLPNPSLVGNQFWQTRGRNSYNALQVDLTQRWSRGLQFRANYTWSKSLDMSAAVTSVQGSNSPFNPMNPYSPERDWGPSALNAAHQASGSFVYELPIGQGKPWLNSVSGATAKLISGWQVNGIVTLLSGFPSTPVVGSNRSGDGDANAPDRVSVNPDFTGPRMIRDPNRWFDPRAFALPTVGTWGNVGRGVLTGPGLAEVDFSLFKTTQISERMGLQFRAEAFNLFNRANFNSPVGTVFLGTNFNPTAGRIASTVTTSRQIQFGLKLTF